MPNLSDGQLSHISKEAEEVLESLQRRINDLENDPESASKDNDTLIKASTKHEVTQRFIRAIEDEQEHRRNNPALKDAACRPVLMPLPPASTPYKLTSLSSKKL